MDWKQIMTVLRISLWGPSVKDKKIDFFSLLLAPLIAFMYLFVQSKFISIETPPNFTMAFLFLRAIELTYDH